MTQAEKIFVVDDDHAVLDALSMSLQAEGYLVEGFLDAQSVMNAVHMRVPSAMLLDVKLPDQSGIEVLRTLRSDNFVMPIIMMTGHGDVPMAVEAIKLGAYDFIEKPFSICALLDQLKRSMVAKEKFTNDTRVGEFDFLSVGGNVLTKRECEVLREIAAGASSKEAGRILGISPRTVEVHRARIMDKLGARNAADLMRILFSHNN
jgi:two-component system, LuxR family, response regulator FixJ